MHKTGILTVLQDAEVPEPKFGETLVDQVDGRVHVQSDWCLWGLASIHGEIEVAMAYRIDVTRKIFLNSILSFAVVDSDGGVQCH